MSNEIDPLAELAKIDAEHEKKRGTLKSSLLATFKKELTAASKSLAALNSMGVEVLGESDIVVLLAPFNLVKPKKGKNKTGPRASFPKIQTFLANGKKATYEQIAADQKRPVEKVRTLITSAKYKDKFTINGDNVSLKS